jgi:hypothetical protein
MVKVPQVSHNSSETLGGMQKLLGGYVEVILSTRLGRGRMLDVWANEEGRIDGSPPNAYVKERGQWVFGTLLLLASDSQGRTVGLQPEEIAKARAWCASLKRATGHEVEAEADREGGAGFVVMTEGE